VRKKNKRKEPEFKKPFIVLSRRKIAGWLLIIFFLSAWMFVLGILVGRGTAPVKFDIAALDKRIDGSPSEEAGQKGEAPGQSDSATVKDKTKLDFYEALKENTEDTKVPVLKKPEAVEGQIDKPAEKTTTQKPSQEKSAPSPTGPGKSKPANAPSNKKPVKEKEKAAVVAKTNTSGPVYTIQAASLKDPQDADELVEKLKKRGYPAYRVIGKIPGKGIWFRVRIGNYKSKPEALRMMDKIRKDGKDGIEPILVMK
jgi:cell division septation protein DedD